MKIIKLILDNDTVHYYGVGDIMRGDLEYFLNEINLAPDMVYTDPPWTNGNCKYWRTIASRQDESIQSYRLSYHSFLLKLKEQLPHTPLFIEGSRLTYNTLINVFSEDYEYNKCYKVFYNDNIEQRLLFFNDATILLELDDMIDLEYVLEAFKYFQDTVKTVLDPCTGLGLTSSVSYSFGKNFIGFDLNKTRLDKTIGLFKDKILEGEELWIGEQDNHS